MPDSLLEQANKAALEKVKAETPQSFTVGGYLTRDGRVVGGVTFDRSWRNGWAATAFAKAWWDDAAVHPNPQVEAGVELVKKF